jgi:hypothetical protein
MRNPPSAMKKVQNMRGMAYSVKVEYAAARKMRERNTRLYRVAHLPIWIWVFFLAPGPLTFDLFAHGGSSRNVLWLLVVIAGTALAGSFGQLPGVEPRPYILRFTEDKPNPLYRKICYTFAWNAVITFTLLNLAGLVIAVAKGTWVMKQIYLEAYFPLCSLVLLLGLFGVLPRARRSTQGEGTERRYFYGAVWAAVVSQTVLLLLWKTLPRNAVTDQIKMAVFLLCLVAVGVAAGFGWLPRTRPIVPGELVVAD